MTTAVHPFTTLLDAVDGDPRLIHVERFDPRPPRFATTDPPVDGKVLDAVGVQRLWVHQAEAVTRLRAGESIVVTTATASGKSVCYQVPIAESVLADNGATALLVFPTKALAQDQLRTFTGMQLPGLVAGTYDGDCSPEQRRFVRANANVVLTNPEMLHIGILPRHEQWASYLRNLRFVVIDELHVLRGVFGSHVAHVLRRLRRLCDHYGASPTFVFTSATIGSPAALASALCGAPVCEVSEDGSPRGERLFALWNPSALDVAPGEGTSSGGPGHGDAPGDNSVADDPGGDDPGGDDPDGDDPDGDDPGGDDPDEALVDEEVDPAAGVWPVTTRTRSAARDAAMLTGMLITQGRRTLAFCRGRRGTELLAAEVQRRLPASMDGAVEPYRGGLLASERRAVERALFDGDLRAVVATTALELGVDVGGLDAVVMNGFPGTTASMWQQAGRAGRGTQPAIAMLVAGDDQLDQWLMAHPEQVFTRPPEPAVINPANPFVLTDQMACAAHELPLSADDHRWWPGLLDEAVRLLVLDDEVRIRPRHRSRPDGPVAVWAGRGLPAIRVGLRSGGGREVRITTLDGDLVGTVDASRAPRQVHPGAIYLHRGRPWRVLNLDLADGEAVVEPAPDGEHTRPRTLTDITILSVDREEPLGTADGPHLAMGSVSVRSQVVAYQRIETRTGRLLATRELDLPEQHLDTRAFWFTVPPAVTDAAGIDASDLPGALHAAEHAAIGMLPLFAICDRSDVGGVSTALHADSGLPTVFIHDAHPGGAGLAELAHARAVELLGATAEVIGRCGCADGCPSCVQSPKCGNGNEPLHKAGALQLLGAVLSHT
jgi:DEAD/DEAH box helicase domain-containing protein